MSVGPVSIHINVWVNIIEYIPIPTPFLAKEWIIFKNAPINNIWIVRPI